MTFARDPSESLSALFQSSRPLDTRLEPENTTHTTHIEIYGFIQWILSMRGFVRGSLSFRLTRSRRFLVEDSRNTKYEIAILDCCFPSFYFRIFIVLPII